ncbi:DUF4179 domain-containing protein [Tepidanaerobacter sp. EBM-38]|uniref:DUF4179 domain-containing protein n=1 Tax=Tepidanaerobacter sp. EBM-38 TaxID=1918496 RepID=UPI000A6DA552|nr:DUF4179 domain-containing protein [Tepidanaerobacter sp. EBM-38]
MRDYKNAYELLNYTKINLEDYDREVLNDVEKQSLKKCFKKNRKQRFNFKKFGMMAAVAVLAVGLLSQTNFGRNVYAAAESKVSEIYYSIGEALGIKRNIEPYANVINQIVEHNGVEIKLTDVIIDKDELIFSTIANANTPVDWVNFDYDIFINGKRLTNYGATGSSRRIGNSETAFSHIYAVDTKGIDLEENIDVKIILHNLNYRIGESEKGIKGKWEFEFTANGSELMANSHALPMNYSFTVGGQKYSLEEFRYNPVNQKFFGKVKGKSKDAYAIELRGHDNLGNEVTFFLTSVSGEDIVFKYENIHGDLSDEITSITLTPYAAKYPEQSGKMSNDYKQVGEEFTMFLMK